MEFDSLNPAPWPMFMYGWPMFMYGYVNPTSTIKFNAFESERVTINHVNAHYDKKKQMLYIVSLAT